MRRFIQHRPGSGGAQSSAMEEAGVSSKMPFETPPEDGGSTPIAVGGTLEQLPWGCYLLRGALDTDAQSALTERIGALAGHAFTTWPAEAKGRASHAAPFPAQAPADTAVVPSLEAAQAVPTTLHLKDPQRRSSSADHDPETLKFS